MTTFLRILDLFQLQTSHTKTYKVKQTEIYKVIQKKNQVKSKRKKQKYYSNKLRNNKLAIFPKTHNPSINRNILIKINMLQKDPKCQLSYKSQTD